MVGPIEYYGGGLARQWIDDNQIVIIITVGDMTHAGIDAWADLLVDTVRGWPPDRPILILHDLSHPNQGFTSYARERAADLYTALPSDREVYHALVVNVSFVRAMINFFLRRRRSSMGKLHERMFTSNREALRWLRHVLSYDPKDDTQPVR